MMEIGALRGGRVHMLLVAGLSLTSIPLAAQQASAPVLAIVGVDVQGGLSPDGRLLSFVDWSSGDLAVRDLERGMTRRVTAKGSWGHSGEFAGRSVFSPDGERLVFAWYKTSHYDLRIIALDGSNLRVIHDDPDVGYIEPLDWSPDGREILATLHRTDRTSRMVRISAEDGAVRDLLAAAPGTARFSPDGAYIAYDSPADEGRPERDVFLVPTAGGEPLPLIAHPADDRGPHWLPDGSGILFVSDRGERVDLRRLGIADGRPIGEPQLVRRGVGAVAPLGLSRSGDLYYAAYAEVRRVYVAALDPDSGEVIGEPEAVSKATEAVYSAPSWSPDGSHLVYVSIRGGPRGDLIFVITPPVASDARAFSAATGSTGRHAAPSWAPDGRRLVASGCAFLCIVDAETGSVRPLDRNSSNGAGVAWRPVWSPDGSKIYFMDESNLAIAAADNRLAVLDLRSGRERELYRGPVRHLALSPDGEWLAFWEHDAADGASVIKLIPSVGGSPRELFRAVPPATIPILAGLAWTSDCGRLLVPRRLAGSRTENELWQIRVADGAARSLGLAMDGLGEYGADVAPDGKHIAFTAGDSSVEVWVLEGVAVPRAHR